jgi:hypothetical protein
LFIGSYNQGWFTVTADDTTDTLTQLQLDCPPPANSVGPTSGCTDMSNPYVNLLPSNYTDYALQQVQLYELGNSLASINGSWWANPTDPEQPSQDPGNAFCASIPGCKWRSQ